MDVPSGDVGTTVLEGKRVKAGETITASFRTDGNTQYALYGVDYMSSIGTWFDKPANEGITFQGKRVKELLVGNDDVNAIHMRVTSIGVFIMFPRSLVHSTFPRTADWYLWMLEGQT